MAVTDAEMFEQCKNDHDSGSSLKTEGGNTSDSAGIAGSGSKFDGLQPALELTRTLRKLRSVKERHDRLPELMDAVVDALPRIPEASITRSTGPFMHIVQHMMSWVDERPIDPQMLARYDRFYKSATQFSYHITDGNTRTGFYRYSLQPPCKARRIISNAVIVAFGVQQGGRASSQGNRQER